MLRMKNTKPKLTFNKELDPALWQKKLKAKIKQLTGYYYKNQHAKVEYITIWKQTGSHGTIEKIVYRSEPGVDVPAYVCIPKNARPPYTFFICLQGHSTGMHNSIAVDMADETKSIHVEGDRDFAIGCMKLGIAALCIEQRSMGERKETLMKQKSDHPCHDAVMHSLMLGNTICAERIFDVARGIDYLQQRGDVKMNHIGIMGNSGGGIIAIYASAVLDRIQYSMPSCAFCTYADSIMQIYHCSDNYIPGILNWAEMADVMGLFAPKPVVIVAGKKDPIFPYHGVQKAFSHLKTIYAAFNASNNCRLVTGDEGHRFYAKEAWETMIKLIK